MVAHDGQLQTRQANGQIGRVQGLTMPIEIAMRRAGAGTNRHSNRVRALKRAGKGALPGSKFERALATQTVVAAKLA